MLINDVILKSFLIAKQQNSIEAAQLIKYANGNYNS